MAGIIKEEILLVGADKECDHEIEAQWSGVKCTKCDGVYCE